VHTALLSSTGTGTCVAASMPDKQQLLHTRATRARTTHLVLALLIHVLLVLARPRHERCLPPARVQRDEQVCAVVAPRPGDPGLVHLLLWSSAHNPTRVASRQQQRAGEVGVRRAARAHLGPASCQAS
jgi:hypothetical protein